MVTPMKKFKCLKCRKREMYVQGLCKQCYDTLEEKYEEREEQGHEEYRITWRDDIEFIDEDRPY